MNSNDCIFCKIAAWEIPCSKIIEDDSVIAFLDIAPVSAGHTLVVPKTHYEKLDQCSADILSSIVGCVGKIAGAIVEATSAEGYNVLCNTGRAAGQVVDHVHFHIIPRFSGDDIFSRWPAGEYQTGQAEVILNSICEKL